MRLKTTYVPKDCMLCNEPPRAILVDAAGLDAWLNGALIQDALPDLSDGEREEVKSGIHEECWDRMFGGDDAEE